jgi:hypothetical protein
MAETSIAFAAIRLSITVECPIVPAMITTLAGAASAYVGPAKLDVPVVAYYSLLVLMRARREF